MINIENLIGKKFTRVTVIDKIDNTHWLCRCDCGESDDFIETTSHLIHGYKKSCGWIAYIHKDKKQKLLGVFDDINDAIVARLKAEKEIFAEFAPQQHLYNQYKI